MDFARQERGFAGDSPRIQYRATRGAGWTLNGGDGKFVSTPSLFVFSTP
jgi:hypothetical protein